jgi:hypothetical protein
MSLESREKLSMLLHETIEEISRFGPVMNILRCLVDLCSPAEITVLTAVVRRRRHLDTSMGLDSIEQLLVARLIPSNSRTCPGTDCDLPMTSVVSVSIDLLLISSINWRDGFSLVDDVKRIGLLDL